MIKLYHAPMTRSLRVLWLLEELGLAYEVEKVTFVPPGETGPFSQKTPFGKLPAIEDGGLVMFESGAIVEYVLERYGKGRLAPPVGTPERGTFLQWLHFSEATMFPPLGEIAWNSVFAPEDQRNQGAADGARKRALKTLAVLEKALQGKDYLLGAEFSAADVMMGYTLLAARYFGVLNDDFPNVAAYQARISERAAFQKALAP
jgi:glutathione S-transferase